MTEKDKILQILIEKVDFKKRGGLCPTIVQEEETNEILMLGYSNKESLKETIKSNYAVFWSTSKNSLWRKGDTSNNRLKISNFFLDCDNDALIFKVILEGQGACHTKDETGKFRKSCFYQNFSPN